VNFKGITDQLNVRCLYLLLTRIHHYRISEFLLVLYLIIHPLVSTMPHPLLGVGERVKWLTPSWRIGCGEIIGVSELEDGTVVYTVQVDGRRVVRLPHTNVMKD
jgi:hypothetical protein